MLGMALGALLTAIRQQATITRIVQEQLEAGSGLQKETPHEREKQPIQASRTLRKVGEVLPSMRGDLPPGGGPRHIA